MTKTDWTPMMHWMVTNSMNWTDWKRCWPNLPKMTTMSFGC
jgi:hypothetical protein